MAGNSAKIIRDMIREELVMYHDISLVENRKNEVGKSNNLRINTDEKDDGEGYKIGGYTNRGRRTVG